MVEIAEIKDLIGKTVTGIQNRHDAITVETDEGNWSANQSGQASVEGRYEGIIGAQIVDADEQVESDNLTVYKLRTATGTLIFRARRTK
jgi:hypothetical protein